MKKLYGIGLFLIFFQTPVFAGDFIVEYVKENYRETRMPASYSPVIYHSVQVSTKAGPKLLVLKGDAYHYRTWLRHYIAQGKQFIARVPDDRDDLFISSQVFEIDVTDLHPVNLALFREGEKRHNAGNGRKPLERLHDDMPENGAALQKEKDRREKALKERQAGLKQKQRDREKEKASQKRLSKEREARERQQRLKERERREAAAVQKRRDALEKQQEIRKKYLAVAAEARAREEQRRRLEMERRWEDLKARLMEDEQLRNMGVQERNREMERRWLELKQRYGFQ